MYKLVSNPPSTLPEEGLGTRLMYSGKLFHLSNPKIMMLIDIGLCISMVHNQYYSWLSEHFFR